MSKKTKRIKRIGDIKNKYPTFNKLIGVLYIKNNIEEDNIELFRRMWGSVANYQKSINTLYFKRGRRIKYCSTKKEIIRKGNNFNKKFFKKYCKYNIKYTTQIGGNKNCI
jgi:hypothetical protein